MDESSPGLGLTAIISAFYRLFMPPAVGLFTLLSEIGEKIFAFKYELSPNSRKMFSSSLWSPRLRLLIAALALSLAGCGGVSDEQALREFKAAFPDVTVERKFVGEGDSDHAYMHFVYTTPAGERLEQMWLYQRQKDNSWRAIHKSEPKPPGSDFGD